MFDDILVTAQDLGAFIFLLMVAAAVGCIVTVIGTIWLAVWTVRAIYRVLTCGAVFEAQRDPDLPDVMMNDYGDAVFLQPSGPSLFTIERAPRRGPEQAGSDAIHHPEWVKRDAP
jgi:hypothetical protein